MSVNPEPYQRVVTGLFIASVVAALLVVTGCAPADDFPDIRRSVVKLTNDSAAPGHGTGAVLGDQGLILTNAHVCQAIKTPLVGVHRFDGQYAKASVLWKSGPEQDLCLLQVVDGGDEMFWWPLSIRDTPVRWGERVMTAGHPWGEDWRTTFGRVSRTGVVIKSQDDGERFDFNGTVGPGASGSPVVDTTGRIVGLVNSVRMVRLYPSGGIERGVNLAIPSATILKLLGRG